MAAATDTARVSSQTIAAGLSHIVNIGSPSAGQLLIVFIRFGAQVGTVTFPAGWTNLKDDSTDATTNKTQIWWKYADGTEGASITVSCTTNGKSAAICWRITNGMNAAPSVSTVAIGTTAANNANPASVAPAGGTQDTLYLAMMGMDGELNAPTAGPSGYGSFITQNSGTAGAVGTNAQVAGASKAATASASDDPGVFTHPAANLGWTAFTVAIRYQVYVPPPATGATAGGPGSFTPVGSSTPANLAAMSGVTASPTRLWYTTEWVVLGDASLAHWTGSAWAVGKGTGIYVPPAMVYVHELKDDFRGQPGIVPDWWPTLVGSLSIDTNRLAIPVAGSEKYAQSPVLSLDESECIGICIPAAGGTQALASRRFGMKILYAPGGVPNETNYMEIFVTGEPGSPYAKTEYMHAYKNGAAVSNGSNQITYDPVYDHSWRIREAGGHMFIETGSAPDPPLTGSWGFGSWVDVLVADMWPVGEVVVRLYASDNSTPAPTTAYVDQINLRPTEVGPDAPSGEPPPPVIPLPQMTSKIVLPYRRQQTAMGRRR